MRVAGISQGARGFTTVPYVFTSFRAAQILDPFARDRTAFIVARVAPGYEPREVASRLREIRDVEEGRVKPEESPLRRAPHTAAAVTAAEWNRPYSREQAAFPLPALRESKFWPSVARIDNAFGDRNLFCTCPSVAEAGD